MKSSIVKHLPWLLLILFFISCSAEIPGKAQSITVITQNIGDSALYDPAPKKVALNFQSLPPADVYLLQEVPNYRYIIKLSRLVSDYSGFLYVAYDGNTATAVMSRFPIRKSSTVHSDTGNGMHAAIQTELEDPEGNRFRAVSVHLPAFYKARKADGTAIIGPLYGALRLVRETFTPNGRSKSITEILIWLDSIGDGIPTVIGGDFNTIPLTLAPRKMAPLYKDSLSGTGNFWQGSYKKMTGPIKPRVDFLFHSKELRVEDGYVYQESAGDHYPVCVRYTLPAAQERGN